MRIAFYAPMKAPDHPLPSGDRQIARLLMAALSLAGHTVERACRFRSYDGRGDPLRQARLAAIGESLARRLASRLADRPQSKRPQLWFTYHLYHKAPDWLGPAICRRLDIPYVVCEASYAPKQATGPWAAGLGASAEAIASADLLLGLNSDDRECLELLVTDAARLQSLPPFIDAAPLQRSGIDRESARSWLRRHTPSTASFPDDTLWLLAVAMMRPGDKLASFRELAAALALLPEKRWRLLIAGNGPVEAEVRHSFEDHQDRIAWLGRVEGDALATVYRAADAYVWPAVNEAFGLAILEAQACGLPVIAGRTRGVPDVVADGESGLLVPPGDVAAFAAAIASILENEALRYRLGRRARQRISRYHDLPVAAARLNSLLRDIAGLRMGLA